LQIDTLQNKINKLQNKKKNYKTSAEQFEARIC
jgi:hypothetical protein